jgi:hypothetical protein
MTGRRLGASSDAGDSGCDPPAGAGAICVFCNESIVKPKQGSVTINERVYHSDCWERLEKRRMRS